MSRKEIEDIIERLRAKTSRDNRKLLNDAAKALEEYLEKYEE